MELLTLQLDTNLIKADEMGSADGDGSFDAVSGGEGPGEEVCLAGESDFDSRASKGIQHFSSPGAVGEQRGRHVLYKSNENML